MTLLFKDEPFIDKLKSIISITWEHTKNLAIFVGIYKSILNALHLVRFKYLCSYAPLFGVGTCNMFFDSYFKVYIQSGRSVLGPPGTSAQQWHSALAGGIGGYLVWAKYTGVNFQVIFIYCSSK